MNDFKVIATIADVHIGNKSISWKEYKYQIKKGIIEPIECGKCNYYKLTHKFSNDEIKEI